MDFSIENLRCIDLSLLLAILVSFAIVMAALRAVFMPTSKPGRHRCQPASR